MKVNRRAFIKGLIAGAAVIAVPADLLNVVVKGEEMEFLKIETIRLSDSFNNAVRALVRLKGTNEYAYCAFMYNPYEMEKELEKERSGEVAKLEHIYDKFKDKMFSKLKKHYENKGFIVADYKGIVKYPTS